ncbi:MAG: hypothetical protein Q8N21_02640 [bacterium]|nr:hypothetical protein [bacterium]
MDNPIALWLRSNADLCVIGVMILWVAVAGLAFTTAILRKLGLTRR